MECRSGCGACCIALSITSPLPGMPEGKPAGVRCVNLERETRRCTLYHTAQYPSFCRDFTAEPDVCGLTRDDAITLIGDLERATAP